MICHPLHCYANFWEAVVSTIENLFSHKIVITLVKKENDETYITFYISPYLCLHGHGTEQ